MHAHIVELNQKDAEALVDKADKVCPYSNAIRGNVNMEFKITAE